MPRKDKITALYEDEVVLAIDKPAGIASLPDRYDPRVPHLRSHLPGHWGPVLIVDGLDRWTSGVMLLARTPDAHRNLNDAFEQQRVIKRCHVLVRGQPDWVELTVDAPLRANVGRRRRTVIDDQAGKPARTELRLLERLGAFTLIEARPITRRTHQIRVHLTASGLQIVGDPLYGHVGALYLSQIKRSYTPGKREERPLIGRVALHAASISFTHPNTGQELSVEAPHAKDLRATLNQLRRLS